MYSENSLNTKKVAKTFQILQLQQKSGYVIAELTSLINALQAAFWLEQEIGNQAQGKI